MPEKRAVLQQRTRDELVSVVDRFELVSVVDRFELPIEDRRVRNQLVEAVATSKKPTFWAARGRVMPDYEER